MDKFTDDIKYMFIGIGILYFITFVIGFILKHYNL